MNLRKFPNVNEFGKVFQIRTGALVFVLFARSTLVKVIQELQFICEIYERTSNISYKLNVIHIIEFYFRYYLVEISKCLFI